MTLFPKLTKEQCAELTLKRRLLRKDHEQSYKVLEIQVRDFVVWLRHRVVRPIEEKPGYRIKGGSINFHDAKQYYIHRLLSESPPEGSLTTWVWETNRIKDRVERDIWLAYRGMSDHIELRTEKVRKWMFIRNHHSNNSNERAENRLSRRCDGSDPPVPVPSVSDPVCASE